MPATPADEQKQTTRLCVNTLSWLGHVFQRFASCPGPTGWLVAICKSLTCIPLTGETFHYYPGVQKRKRPPKAEKDALSPEASTAHSGKQDLIRANSRLSPEEASLLGVGGRKSQPQNQGAPRCDVNRPIRGSKGGDD